MEKFGCHNKENEMNFVFQNLTPKKDIDIKVYEEAIDYAFATPEVKNIAISGSYGAGKSSVLATYENLEKNKDKKFIHISLACFGEKQEKEEEEESTLEKKVLNQLIHQVPPENIPQTHFKVKRTISKGKVVKYSAFAVLYLLLFFSFIFYSKWSSFLEVASNTSWVRVFQFTTSPTFRIFTGVALIFLSTCLFYFIIKAQLYKNMFIKLNINGTEIDIFEKTEDSCFDKYLNEILYLLSQAKADAIVFEDIDRYDNSIIFERLREINTLVNSDSIKMEKKPIRFFYLLKDDVFLSKDRTKFFDFIVPIVPVVAGSNSFNQLKELLEKNKIYDIFDCSFLQDVSLYVDEMRLLINICNEFLVYHHRIAEALELDPNKMLAMVIYKNLFPKDFGQLQLGRGYVSKIFERKTASIEEEINKTKNEISSLRKRQNILDLEPANSQAELDVIFKEKVPYQYRSSKVWDGYLPSQEQSEYKRRTLLLEEKAEYDKEEVKAEIVTLVQRLAELSSMRLSNYITKKNEGAIFYFTETENDVLHDEYNEVRNSYYFNLLKFLLRNGYIDETYSDYITYFYPNNLSLPDKNFLISVTDRVAKEYTHEIKNPELVFSRLKLSDFDQEEILNFSLLDYLLQKKFSSQELSRFLQQLKDTKNFDFIFQYFDFGKEKLLFVEKINESWPGYFSSIVKNDFGNAYVRAYSLLSLYASTEDVLKKVNIDNCLTQYISKSKDYLSINNPDVDLLIQKLKALNVRFEKIEADEANPDLLKEAYRHSLYVLSFENIKLMLEMFYSVPKNEKSVRNLNYTLICSQPESPLFQYVSGNISEYIAAYLEFCDNDIKDVEEYALKILNNKNISSQQKEQYLECLSNPILSLSSIEDADLWAPAIKNGSIVCTEANVLEYYTSFESLDEVVVQFINRFPHSFNFDNVESGVYEEVVIDSFVDEFLVSKHIDNKHYKQFVTSLSKVYSAFELKDISSEKINIILGAGIIEMNEENLNFIRDNYPDCTLTFIQNNFDSYVEIMDVELLDHEELLEILSWDVKDSLKISLLKCTDSEISIVGKNYSEKVKMHILNNNRMDSDLQHLFSKYPKFPAKLKALVFSIAISSINVILDKKLSLSDVLYSELLGSNLLTLLSKTNLLANNMHRYTQETVLCTLKQLGISGFDSVFDKTKRPRIQKNDINTCILNAFVKRRWLLGFHMDSVKPGYYILKRIPKLSRNKSRTA